MKIKEFIKEKRWHLVSGALFLIIFAVITGIFANNIYKNLDNVRRQNDLISSSIKSLETSSTALANSIYDSAQDVKDNSSGDLLIYSLKSDIDSIIAKLSALGDIENNVKELMVLKSELEQLNNRLKNISGTGAKAPKPSEDDTTTISDPEVPSGQAIPTAPSEIKKEGQDIIVTVRADSVKDLYGYQFNLNYDKSKFTYKGGLKSSINEISTIFEKDKSDYLLVGATMIGDRPGYSADNVTVCTLVFTTISDDYELSDFKVSSVCTVDSKENFLENVKGWSCEAKAE